MIKGRPAYIFFTYLFARYAPAVWVGWQNRIVSRLSCLFLGKVRRTVQKNIAVVTGTSPHSREVARLTRQFFENYGRYLLDYSLLGCMDDDLCERRIAREIGAEHMKQALEGGKGAILVSPHLGNWELGGAVFARRGCPMVALTIRGDSEEDHRYRIESRRHLNVETMTIDPENVGNVIKLARELGKNKVVVMLGDRWEGGKTAGVNFFGRKVRFPCGAVILAQVTGAPIIPVFLILRPDGRYDAVMEDPIRVVRKGKENRNLITKKTQELASVFEAYIRKHPDQWYHFSDYWARHEIGQPSSVRNES